MITTIIITGCTQGLGFSLAKKLASKNHKVIAVGRNDAKLKQLSDSSGNITPIVADIATDSGRASIVKSVSKEDSVSIVHNAAIALPFRIDSLSESLFRDHFETNFFAAALLNQKLLPVLKNNSRVLHISSGAADLALAGLMPYCVSESALEHMSLCFNSEFNAAGVFFANLRPGMMDTNMQDTLRNTNNDTLQGVDYYRQAKADNKLLSPDIVADFVAWVLLKTTNKEFSRKLWNIADFSAEQFQD